MTMPHVLDHSRTRTTSVVRTNSGTLHAACRLQDTLMDAEVEIVATLPDLEIKELKSHVFRDEQGSAPITPEALERTLGVRIGPGMSRIMGGLVGKDFPCRQLIFMIEECCHGIILYFTREDLSRVPETEEEVKTGKLCRHVDAVEVLNGKVTREENRLAGEVASSLDLDPALRDGPTFPLAFRGRGGSGVESPVGLRHTWAAKAGEEG